MTVRMFIMVSTLLHMQIIELRMPLRMHHVFFIIVHAYK